MSSVLAPTKPFSRRHFLTGSAAVVGGVVITSCGRNDAQTSDQNTDPGADSGSASDAGTKTVRIGALGKPAAATRDPHEFLPNDSDMLIMSLIYDAFTVPSETEQVAARLMESWTQVNPTTWQFNIAKGAKFHDGSPVTPEDVVWSMKRMLADENQLFKFPVIADSIRVEGDSAIQCDTDAPNSQLPLLARLMTFVMKKDSTPENPIGSGPFKLESWNDGRATLTRFDDYHGGRPGSPAIEVIPFEDVAAMTNAIIAGQIDVAQAVGAVAARTAESRDNLVIQRRPNDSVIPLIMNTASGPFADPRVREAVRLGVDRAGIIDAALSGYGSVANDVLGTGDPLLDTSLPQRQRDVAKAKKLLAEAGFDTAKEYELKVTPETPGQVDAMKIIAMQLGDIGMKVKVVEQESGVFYDETWCKADLYCGYWGTNDSVAFFGGKTLNSEASANESQWNNTEFDAAYHDLLEASDDAGLKDASERMQRLQYEDGGYLVWGAADGVDIAVKGVSGLPTAPGYGRVLVEQVTKS